MKCKHISGFHAAVLLILSASVILAPAAMAELYKLDPAHTSIIFRVKHLGVAYVFGRFNGATGTFSYDQSVPSDTSIHIQVATNNIDTNDEKRDKHLKSPDFFNAVKFPLITFKSSSVTQKDKDLLSVSGHLTILGKTNPVTIEVRRTGAAKDPWGNYRIGFESSFTIRRTDYGMNFMLGGVSNEVNLTVSVEGIKQ